MQNTAEDEDDEAGQSGYTAAFARLHHAARAESESVPDVRDPTRYLAESVARSSQVHSMNTVSADTLPTAVIGLTCFKVLAGAAWQNGSAGTIPSSS